MEAEWKQQAHRTYWMKRTKTLGYRLPHVEQAVRQWGRALTNGFRLPDPIVTMLTGSTGPALWEQRGHQAGPQVLFLVTSFAPTKEVTARAAWRAYNNKIINRLHKGRETDKSPKK
jgi:hypothetical protein